MISYVNVGISSCSWWLSLKYFLKRVIFCLFSYVFKYFFMCKLMLFIWLYDVSWWFVWVLFYLLEKNVDFFLYFMKILIFLVQVRTYHFFQDSICFLEVFLEILDNYLCFFIYMYEYAWCFVWYSFDFWYSMQRIYIFFWYLMCIIMFLDYLFNDVNIVSVWCSIFLDDSYLFY